MPRGESAGEKNLYSNCWLASLPQSYGMQHCLEKIGRYYKRPPQAYWESSKKRTLGRKNNTWQKKRTHNDSREEGTRCLTGPIFLGRHLEGTDDMKATEKPTKVQDFMMFHCALKDDDPVETRWREVNAKNKRASESPF